MKNHNELNSIDTSALTMAFSEFYPGIQYGAVSTANEHDVIDGFLGYGDDFVQELPFAEDSLLDYRQRNEMC